MGTSRKRQSSPSSSSTSDSGSDSRSKDEKTPPPRRKNNNNNQSPRRQSFNTSYNSNTSLNTSHNRSQNNKSMSTPSKYVGGDRAGLEPYLIERKRRKEERDAEKGNRVKEEKRTEERKSRDRKMKPDKSEEKKQDPTAPNYEKSGKLTEDRNTYKGIVIKYSEPQEARIPKTKWRLYPFKGEETLPTMYIHRNSGYLIGRERKVVDIPADHPSCSSQHAVVQFRLVDHIRGDGSQTKKVKPYVMDLESTNGSFLNNVKIEPRRYYELKERDIIKFGFSTREYVLLHERSEGVMDTES